MIFNAIAQSQRINVLLKDGYVIDPRNQRKFGGQRLAIR